MSRSSVLSAQGSLGSTLVLGAGQPQPSSFVLSWAGPFTPGQVYFTNEGKQIRVDHSTNITVTAAEYAALTRSDPTWWVLVG